MKNKWIVALLTLSSLLLSFAFREGHAESNVAALPASVQQSAQKTIDAPQRGTLFRVRHQGSTAYLFGTIHFGQPSFYPLESEVTNAFARAHTLVVEFDIRNTAPLLAATQKYALYANGDSIQQHISAENLQRLKQALQGFGIPFENVAQMKPWMISNLLIAITLERNGFQSNIGIDAFLLGQATVQRKAVRELESADYQMSLFEAMSEKEQENYLAENLADLSDGKLLEKTRALVDAWSSADDAAFAKITREELDEQTTSAAFMQRVMLDKRNPEMAEKIEALLKRDGTTFVGVGMLHLFGDKGIPELLRQRGYAVEKLY